MAELMVPSITAALGSLVIVLSKMGLITRPAWDGAALARRMMAREAATRPPVPRRTPGPHPFSPWRRLIGDSSEKRRPQCLGISEPVDFVQGHTAMVRLRKVADPRRL